MPILDELSDAVLLESFDALTLHRAREYVADGRVSAPRITDLGDVHLTASASVAGSRPVPYRVQLTADVDEEGPWVMTSCSCPVRSYCKHGAALALTLRTSPEPTAPSTPAWESQLRGLLTDLAEEARPDDDLTPLAVEVTLESSRSVFAVSQQPTVRLRPLRLGGRGRWVKTGADWPDLIRSHPGKDFPRGQLVPLQELGRALQSERAYWYAGTHAPLEDFGLHGIDLLGDAVAGGVTLLPGAGIKEVEVLHEALPLTGHASRDADRVVLRFGLTYADRLLAGPTVIPLGRPAHSVAVMDAGVLRLARLGQRLNAAAQGLVTAAEPLVVPEQDTASLSALLGPLARLVPVLSPDESVEVPDPPSARLELTVPWHSATRAALLWQWRYAERRYPLESRDDLGTVRDVEAEGVIRARVPKDLVDAIELTDGDALALAVHDLPALREVPDVDVVERERPDFRESDDEPEISFELAAAPDDHTDWLDLEVVIVVEGEPVPLPDVLAALTRDEEFLVLPSGLYLRTDRPEFARLREVVAAASQLHERREGRLAVGKHDLGVWADLAELGVVADQAAQWVARAQALRDLVEIPRPEPVGLATELRTYQREGFWWLSFLFEHGLGGILADDMGLGKTLQVLALIARAAQHGSTDGKPFLVVAPTSVLPAWQSEAARHTPGLRVATVTRRSDDVSALASGADLVVTTYAMLRLERDRFAALSWTGLVLDEAQQVKNHQSKTYAAARRIDADFRLAVTGTPFENRLMELWSLLSIVAPGLYPHSRQFRDQVVRPVEKDGDEPALGRFRKRIAPFLLRRTKEIVADDLPPKQEQVLGIELSAQHRRLYDAHLARERQRILHLLDEPGGFEENRVAILSALTRLRQLALSPALLDEEHAEVGSAKLDVLVDHLAEITAEGHKALVFSQFTSFLGLVRDRLDAEGIATTYLDGATRDRAGVVDRFRSGEVPVFLISLKAGGVGLTLTEADYVFVLDPWWNPAAEAQAVDRAHRIGQTRHVIVYRLVSDDTIEEKVMELKGRKAELFSQVIDGSATAATGITADDIRGLFTD